MKPVIQQELTGCGIASSAAIADVSYKKAKDVANGIGIYADDASLWSDTKHVCTLVEKLGFNTNGVKTPFKNWQSLPACALLATKWHKEQGKPYWHWAVFIRENNNEYVLDSKKALKTNKRTDFGRIKPKWFIKVNA